MQGFYKGQLSRDSSGPKGRKGLIGMADEVEEDWMAGRKKEERRKKPTGGKSGGGTQVY